MKRHRTKAVKAENGAPKTIHQLRTSLQLSQQQLGDMFGLSQVAISLVETGVLTVPGSKRQEIENALGVKIQWPE